MKRRKFVSSLAAAALAPLTAHATWNPDVNQKYQRNESPAITFDVIVIGVGTMGSATCATLAARGFSVLGLEQFDIPHEFGSHAGQSRIIRKAYFEHPDYVPLLIRSYELWKKLGLDTGTKTYYDTGFVYFGDPGHALLKGVKESARLYKIPLENINSKESAKRFPQFRIPANFETIFERDAGFLLPETSVLLFAEQAVLRGADIRTKEKVTEWKRDGEGVNVITNKGKYQARKLIITAGPWAGKMMPGLSAQLRPTRQMVAWVKPKKWKDFALYNFPCWTIADDVRPGIFYGFPILPTGQFGGPIGLKLAHHYQGQAVDPDLINREPTAEDEEVLKYILNKYIPDAYESTLTIKACMYTNTPDENFVIDHLPGYDGVVSVACGFSGHGFKFAPAVGEVLSDLAMLGKTSLPIGFLNAKRFK